MNPATVKAAAALFSACLAVHLALWRLPAARRIPVLFAVFFLPPLALLAGAPFSWSPLPLGALLGVVLGHVALSCAYIQSYPAMVPAAPTLRILLLVSARGKDGATAEQLHQGLDTRGLMEESFAPLLAGGLLRQEPGSQRLEITARGRALVAPFLLLRGILGLPPGGG